MQDLELFPADCVLRDDNKAAMKMPADDIFAPTKEDVSNGCRITAAPCKESYELGDMDCPMDYPIWIT